MGGVLQWLQELRAEYGVLVDLVQVVAPLLGGMVAVQRYYRRRFRDKDAKIKGLEATIEDLEGKNAGLRRGVEELTEAHAGATARLPETVLATFDKETADGNFERAHLALVEWLAREHVGLARIAGEIGEHYAGFLAGDEAAAAFEPARRHLALAAAAEPGNARWARALDEVKADADMAALRAGAPLDDVEDDFHFGFARSNRREEVEPLVDRLADRAFELVQEGRYFAAVLISRRAIRVAERVLGPGHALTWRAQREHAQSLHFAGRSKDALPIAKEGWEATRRAWGPDAPATLANAHLVTQILHQGLGRGAEAEGIARSTWEAMQRVSGPKHPDTLAGAHIVAQILHQGLGRSAEAEGIARATWETTQRVLGPEHPQTLHSAHLVAQILHQGLGRSAEAEGIARSTWETEQRVLGPEHRDTLGSAHLVAHILHQGLGRSAEAEGIARATWEASRRTLGETHPGTLMDHMLVAQILGVTATARRGLDLALPACEALRGELGDDHRYTLRAAGAVARLLSANGNRAEAEALATASLERAERVLGQEHFATRALATLIEEIRAGAAAPAAAPAA